jgi:D-glycero-alpha-D-manno-heptose-7-phosphate kinase
MIEAVTGKIRSRAPLRLGFAGGGTDLSPYCDTFGGAVLNVTIDRFAFASILPSESGKIVFAGDDMGIVETFDLDDDLQTSELALHKGVYLRMIRDYNNGRRVPMVVKTTVDAPPGSGLGSSSALVVALVEAFRIVLAAPLGPYDVARLAFDIERVDLAMAGGRQDQYAAAFGGINFIEFLAQDRVIVNPMRVSDAVKNELESSLVVCFSGRSRKSADIISLQTAGLHAKTEKTMEAMHQLKADAVEMKSALLRGDVEEMADVLNRSWIAKKSTAQGISNDRIDDLFDLAMRGGALGGKVSGAGGGGFLFFLVHPEHRYSLVSSLNAEGAVASPVKFTERGCETWAF